MPFVFASIVLAVAACSSEPARRQRLDGEPRDEAPETAAQDAGPEFHEGKLRVYTSYRPQIQRRDFNGVFDISSRGARIVQRFWKQRFDALTRPGYYGEFFIEFYDYMAFLAQSYPMQSEQKEKALEGLEKTFRLFCSIMGIERDFDEFQTKRESLGMSSSRKDGD